MGCCDNWTDETTFHFWNIFNGLNSVGAFLILYMGLAKPPDDDVPQKVNQNMVSAYASAAIGVVGAILYLNAVIDKENASNRVKVYYVNVLGFMGMYIGLAVDTIWQLLDNSHLCSEKYIATDHFGKPEVIPCETITYTLIIVDIVMICLIPLWRIMLASIRRFALGENDSHG